MEKAGRGKNLGCRLVDRAIISSSYISKIDISMNSLQDVLVLSVRMCKMSRGAKRRSEWLELPLG